MLLPRIIPCLDVRDGRVVKGVRFRDLAEVGDPVECAVRYEQQGADEIVFLDITASLEGRRAMLDVVRRTAERLSIPLTVGGGVRSFEDVRDALRAGADKVAINTAALADPGLIARCADAFGAQCIVVAIDSRREADGHRVWSHGATRPTGRETVAWAQEAARHGAGEILLTSIDRDGTTDGYDIALTRAVADAVPVPVIASGGCGDAEHIRQAIVDGHAAAALAASIFHYGRLTVGEVKRHLAALGVPVRLAPAGS